MAMTRKDYKLIAEEINLQIQQFTAQDMATLSEFAQRLAIAFKARYPNFDEVAFLEAALG